MELVAIVTGLALLQAFMFAFQVGQARVKYDCPAPATSGPPEFERAFRVHMNTIEQLVLMIPSLWIFANFVRPDIAAGLGVVWIIARQIYRGAYIGDPSRRSMGFGLGALVLMVLLIGGMIGAVMRLI